MSSAIKTHSRWLALGGISIASFLGCIDFTIVNTAIPAIQTELNASIDQSQWVVTMFVMALCSFMIAAGRLADLYGRRGALYTGMLVFALASLGAGLSTSIGMLIAWRFVQGLSCAVLYTTSASLVADAFAPRQRGMALGLLFAANGLGLAAGPVAGGLLVAAWGWRSVFLLNVPLIVLAFALCLGQLQASRPPATTQKLDIPGLLLLMLGIPGLLLLISHAGEWGWGSVQTLLLAGGTAVLLALFIRIELRAEQPLVNLGIFTNRRFIAASIATFCLAFFYCAAFFLMPLYLGFIRGQDNAGIGWMLLPTTLVMAAVSPLAGRLVDRYTTTPVLIAGLLFLALSALIQSRFTLNSDLSTVLLAFASMGIGWGCMLGPSTMAALSSVPEQLGAVAMGTSWTLHNLGGALGVTIATALYTSATSSADVWTQTVFLSGFQAAMGLLVGVSLAGGLAVLALSRRPGMTAPAQTWSGE